MEDDKIGVITVVLISVTDYQAMLIFITFFFYHPFHVPFVPSLHLS